MENTLSDNEVFDGENADLIYAFDAAPGAVPGESGLVFAALSSGLRRSQDGGRTWEDALAQLNLSEPVPVPGLVIPAGFEEEPRVLAGKVVNLRETGLFDVALLVKGAVRAAVAGAALSLTTDSIVHRRNPPLGVHT